MSEFNKLPLEINEEIFKFLDSKDLRIFYQTNQHCAQLVKDLAKNQHRWYHDREKFQFNTVVNDDQLNKIRAPGNNNTFNAFLFQLIPISQTKSILLGIVELKNINLPLNCFYVDLVTVNIKSDLKSKQIHFFEKGLQQSLFCFQKIIQVEHFATINVKVQNVHFTQWTDIFELNAKFNLIEMTEPNFCSVCLKKISVVSNCLITVCFRCFIGKDNFDQQMLKMKNDEDTKKDEEDDLSLFDD